MPQVRPPLRNAHGRRPNVPAALAGDSFPHLPVFLDTFLSFALSIDPRQRFPDATTARTHLRNALDTPLEAARAHAAFPRLWLVAPWAGTLLGVLICAFLRQSAEFDVTQRETAFSSHQTLPRLVAQGVVFVLALVLPLALWWRGLGKRHRR